MSGALPPSASVATPVEGVKLFAPSAERNAQTLCDLLRANAPQSGRALEIASGTGQHIARFAAALPDLHWQPSDIDPARLKSIDAYVQDATCPNVAPAVLLNAAQPGWGTAHQGLSLIVLINLLHLILEPDARTILTEAAQALAPDGTLILYGPFARDGKLTSAGDARFDAELRGADPAIGYKDTRDIMLWLRAAGLNVKAPCDMPANNLAFIARKASS